MSEMYSSHVCDHDLRANWVCLVVEVRQKMTGLALVPDGAWLDYILHQLQMQHTLAPVM